MSCSHFEELIAWATSEDLTPEEREGLDAHLEECPACRQFAVDMETSQEVVTSLASVALPEAALAEVRERLNHEIEAQAASRRRVFGMAFLPWAALILMTVSIWWWLPGEHRTPKETPSWAPTSPPKPSKVPGIVVKPLPDETGDEPRTVDDASASGLAETIATTEVEAEGEAGAEDSASHTRRSAPEPGVSTELPTSSPSPSTEIASSRPLELSGVSPVSPSNSTQTAGANSPAAAATEPMVVKWISEDPDLVIYWLVDTQSEEETPNAISNSVPSEV